MKTFRRDRPEAGCASDLMLDELVGELLTDPAKTALEAHLLRCVLCQHRWQAIKTSSQIELPRLERPKARVIPLFAGRAVAPMLLAGIAASTLLFAFAPPPEEETIRTKGRAHLSFYVKHGARVRRGGLDEPVHPGDELRFAYSMAHPSFVAVLSLDPAWSASVYYPLGDHAVRHASGHDALLPLSTRLDETLGDETVFGLFCDRPIALERIRKRIEQERRLAPVPGCRVDALRLRKVPLP